MNSVNKTQQIPPESKCLLCPAFNHRLYFESAHDPIVIHHTVFIVISSLSFKQVKAVKPILKVIEIRLQLFIKHLKVSNIQNVELRCISNNGYMYILYILYTVCD